MKISFAAWIHQLWVLKWELAIFTALIASAHYVATSDWKRGLVVGFAICGLVAFLAKVVRRIKQTSA